MNLAIVSNTNMINYQMLKINIINYNYRIINIYNTIKKIKKINLI